jgi:hypothetical protein
MAIAEMNRDALRSGSQEIIVAGRLRYRDGFPDTPVAETTYCYQTSTSPVTGLVYLGHCQPGSELSDIEEAESQFKNR